MTSQPQPVTRWVALGGVVTTGVALAAVLWPDRLEPIAQAAIIAFANAVILAVANWRAVSQVTPTSSPNLTPGTTGHIIGSSETFTVPTPGLINGGDPGP